MSERLTELQETLIDRFWPQARTKEEKDILVVLGLGARSSEIEDEILAFIDENPHTGITELGDKFMFPQGPLEIVDDAGLNEDD